MPPGRRAGGALRRGVQRRCRRDGGAAIVAGNERVLRARLSDARFFWDQDLKQPLEHNLAKLEGVVFHARLGTQGSRVRAAGAAGRADRAAWSAPTRRWPHEAAQLAKADLATGMVAIRELQGVMGRYYALKGGEDPRVAEAIGLATPGRSAGR